jgi:hypothetical protein
MATTNLISKSLGDTLVQTGNGTPDHTSPIGSLYTDQNTGTLYKNNDGSTAWINMQGVAYGEVYYVNNTNSTTISAATEWFTVTNTFTEGDVIAFSASTDSMVLKNGYDGKYEITANATLDYVAGADNFEVGVSVSGAVPIDGSYNSGNVDVTYTTANVTSNFITDLVGGDTLQLAVQNLDGANSVIIQHGQIFAKLID